VDPGLLSTLGHVNPTQIHGLDELEKGLAAQRFLLFKHSTRCGTSDRAFREYSRFIAEQSELPSGWIDVAAQRDWSDEVARRTGIGHQSPQAIWIRDGAVAWHASHWDITVSALTEAGRS